MLLKPTFETKGLREANRKNNKPLIKLASYVDLGINEFHGLIIVKLISSGRT
jgi:hypothetical protein